MESGQVQRDSGVTLVGGGEVLREDIEAALEFAPHLVAADGGADSALALSFTPEAVIGDFDSVSEDARRRLPDGIFLYDSDQNTTDFQKCLARINAPLILAVGFLGGRLDHTLAACAGLAQRQGPPTILIGADEVIIAVGKTFEADLPADTRVSLFPFQPTRHASAGLAWSFDDLTLDPLGRLGTSNAATGAIRLTFEHEGTLLILSRHALPHLLDALLSG